MEWWVWLLLILVLVTAVLVLWWWWQSRPVVQVSSETPAVDADDLAVIEGIGPRIHDVLHDAGITTFAQLADIDVTELQRILTDAELPPAHPDTWPEQARLAAEGRMEELKSLQDSLRGGRAT